MKANTTSTKNIHGTEYTVNVYAPTFEEWVKHFTRGGERMAEDYNQHKIANNLASALKASVAVAIGHESAPEKPSDETKAKAENILERLKAGDVFDLREFVGKDGRSASDKRMPINDYDGKVALINARWKDAPEAKRAGLLATLKLDAELVAGDASDVVAAFEAKYKPEVKVETASLL